MDQSGDASGGFSPQSTADPTLTPGGSPGAAPAFGAPASSFAPPAGGGGAVSAPGGAAAPSASPAGFDSLSPQSQAEFGSPNPAQTGTTQLALGGDGGGGSGATAPAAGGAQQGSNSVLNAIRNPSVDSVLNAVGGNIGTLGSLGILGFEAANRPSAKTQELAAGAEPRETSAALVQEAGTLQTAGQTLSQPLATGVLPPGAQNAIDEVTKQQEAQIRQQFASMGLSGSSMEASAIAQAQQAAQARGFQLAQQMAQQGLSDLNLSSNLFGELLNAGLQQDTGFQDALSKFAAAAAGGGGTTIKVGG